jgi:signal peptidase II
MPSSGTGPPPNERVDDQTAGAAVTVKRLSLVLALVVVVLDQLTKWWILDQVMRPPRLIELTPFFNLVLVWNRGVSFGLFNTDSSWNGYVLSGIAIAIIAVLLVWLRRVDRWMLATAIGLVIGGAIGNVIDRVRFGAVCDFLDLHAFGYHWPAFNVADSAISVGAAILVVDALARPREAATGR